MFPAGQRQRLSIARAIAVEPNVYIFDDLFLRWISRLMLNTLGACQRNQAKPCFIVGQRINTIMNADKIIVLDEGKIVGQGNAPGIDEKLPSLSRNCRLPAFGR